MQEFQKNYTEISFIFTVTVNRGKNPAFQTGPNTFEGATEFFVFWPFFGKKYTFEP
jgi:predicted Na+-dependent transporter